MFDYGKPEILDVIVLVFLLVQTSVLVSVYNKLRNEIREQMYVLKSKVERIQERADKLVVKFAYLEKRINSGSEMAKDDHYNFEAKMQSMIEELNAKLQYVEDNLDEYIFMVKDIQEAVDVIDVEEVKDEDIMDASEAYPSVQLCYKEEDAWYFDNINKYLPANICERIYNYAFEFRPGDKDILTMAVLDEASDEQLLEIPGIGKNKVKKIRDIIDGLRGRK